MAGRAHVDSAVAERRLRPIYDWLDNNNNKKALQEAEKVLKKQPNFLCAKVLKGLAYLRMGKEGDCQTLLDAVRAEEPSDDSTLQAMSICYRELHQPHAVVQAYQAAVRKCPTNEELLTHLFMAYVRVGDLKKQQAQALALYRLRPKNPYYFWAVMSIVMQAQAGDGAGAAISLALAERMVAKFCQEGRIEAEQEVHLYLMILEMQGKTEAALEVLNGPLADKLVTLVSVPSKRCQLLVKLERWREANLLVKNLLLQDINQWSFYQTYLDTGFQLVNQLSSQPDNCQEEILTTDRHSDNMEVKSSSSNIKGDDKKLSNVEGDDKNSPNVESDDKKLSNVESDDKKLSNIESDDKKSPNVESDDKKLSNVESDDKKSPNVESNDKNSPNVEDDDKKLSNVESDDKKLSNFKSDDKKLSNFEDDDKKLSNVESDDETTPVMEADDSYVKMAAFLERLQGENRLRERAERGPALARLEMFRRLDQRNLPAENWLGPSLNLLLAFIVKFGDRPCCVSDVRPFLALVPKTRKQELLELLAENVDLPSGEEEEDPSLTIQLETLNLGTTRTLENNLLDNNCFWLPRQLDGCFLPKTRHQMLRHVVALQLARCLGAHVEGGASKHAIRLEALHAHGTALCLQATPTEFRCNDGYALLAAYTHLDVWLKTRADQYVVRALAVLRRAAAESTHNFHVKLLQLRVLQEIGAGLAANQAYLALDVKHVQLDSMGHLHSAHLAHTGQLTTARELLDHTLKFFASNYKDSVEHLTFSYKFGSFGKIGEFCAFRSRLHASAHRALCSACAATWQLCFVRDLATAKTQLDAAQALARDVLDRIETLTDNRDLSLLVTWTPPHKCISEHCKAASFSRELELIRLRCLLLLCVSNAILGDTSTDSTDVSQLLSKLCDRCQHATEDITCNQDLFAAPLSSCLSSWPWDATRELVNLAKKVGDKGKICQEDFTSITKRADILCAEIKTHCLGENQISNTRKLMHRCITLGEVLSFVVLLVASCRVVTPGTSQRRPRRRRDDDTMRAPGIGEAAALSASLAALALQIKTWPAPNTNTDVDAFDKEACKAVLEQLSESHTASVCQVSSWLESRRSFLDAD